MSLIYKEFKKIAEIHGKRQAVLWKEQGIWRHYNYKEFLSMVDRLASGLAGLGVKPGERAAILSENRPEWLITDLALNKIGAISAPIHITSNRPLIEYILKDSNSGFLIISNDLFTKHYDLFSKTIFLEKIILLGERRENLLDNVVLFNDIIKQNKNGPELALANDDLASIIYTSGTTGEPKGVMLTNKNFLFNIQSACRIIKVMPQDKLLSFLPLSHVLERTAGSYIPILSGAAIAYAENIKKLADNLGEVKPTILISVPKIFEKMYEKIFSGLKTKSNFQKNIFFWSLKQKEGSFGRILAGQIIYKKIKKIFGGRLRFAVSGGASINEQILRFFKNVGLKIIEGYGLTETAPLVSINALTDIKIGSVGRPIPNIKVKIAPDKEILVKGDNVMSGYWHKPEMTQEVLSKDGWFKTGDLGFLDKDNFLTIIGRKKEIIVTSNGKNIYPERIESLINLSPYIEQSLIVGHGRSFLAALIVLSPESFLEKLNTEEENKIINKEIDKINKQLQPHEQIRKIKILDKPFSLADDELTPTLKVRRKIIESRFKKTISEIYSDG